ncbi:MAG: glutamate-cysteine ligase family protein, partial [Bdellovibrionaceae bacterium]|nr:glutamate-cysteine ligase family protein [Pseudobdellovibrionaceae bacterium]
MRWKEIGRSLRFGLESEYLVCSRPKMDPLWYKQLTFAELNSLIESIPLDGLPSLCGLEVEPPHRKQMPFVVEGYHLPDMDFQAKDLLPKGLEIRTPVCSSLPELLSVHQELHSRLRSASRDRGLEVVALSHHPLESEFSGPQNKRRHDYWLWS